MAYSVAYGLQPTKNGVLPIQHGVHNKPLAMPYAIGRGMGYLSAVLQVTSHAIGRGLCCVGHRPCCRRLVMPQAIGHKLCCKPICHAVLHAVGHDIMRAKGALAVVQGVVHRPQDKCSGLMRLLGDETYLFVIANGSSLFIEYFMPDKADDTLIFSLMLKQKESWLAGKTNK